MSNVMSHHVCVYQLPKTPYQIILVLFGDAFINDFCITTRQERANIDYFMSQSYAPYLPSMLASSELMYDTDPTHHVQKDRNKNHQEIYTFPIKKIF